MSLTEVLSGKRKWWVEAGPVLRTLRQIPDDSVQCCVCSPPYYKLRAYLPKEHPDKVHELGQEPSPDCYGWATKQRCGVCFVCKLTEVFREVRRVLRPDGTFWLNIAGSYNGSGSVGGKGKQHTSQGSVTREDNRQGCPDWKPKDFIDTPHLLAESLRVDGWYRRKDITLTKVAPMPDSVTDRPTSATEMLFMFSKSERYWYDKWSEAVPMAESSKERYKKPFGGNRSKSLAESGQNRMEPQGNREPSEDGRNLWDYWDDADEDTPEGCWNWTNEGKSVKKHYATFPMWLPRRCLNLGGATRGVCPHCRTPLVRDIQKSQRKRSRPNDHVKRTGEEGTGNVCPNTVAGVSVRTLAWKRQCQCPEAPAVPALVLDPFSGSGTTGEVAVKMGLHYLGCELNPEYAADSRKRLHWSCPVF